MTKTQARVAARETLLSLPPDARTDAGEVIADFVWEIPEIAAARTLLLYASLPDEVSTDAVANEAVRRGLIITFPRCLPETRAMALHRLSGLHELRDGGSYGIREPEITCPLVNLAEIDVALVPGVAWDRNGGRLGRGAGYYDRLFADPEWHGFRCGLFFAAQEMAAVPQDRWDAKLDVVVTEQEIWRSVAL